MDFHRLRDMDLVELIHIFSLTNIHTFGPIISLIRLFILIRMNISTLITTDHSGMNMVTIDVAQVTDTNLTELVTAKGYLFLAIEILLMVVILVGNGLTITAIFTTPTLQTITYRYVLL